ncbi:hypothetical protein JOD57_004719 [Geodermatophilus bullaregiensis]|uniref:hypothetical protein n=1 Tax=Geodermatophilus bullaregiensis TaxID=1564160 RepID=UPI001956C808|nr:hypothetical protein [Geodermatophilus bullaregiensis]MBM7808882.1 hypothetical protein [Geodermatophilus bullaregiensis]
MEAATRAPSIHNTQPWLFRADGDRLQVRTDPFRALATLDPSGRQRVLSCGVAAESAVVALTAAGCATDVEVLPEAGDPDLLATVIVTGGYEPDEEDRVLGQAITARHTERAPFLPRAVPDELVDRLQATAGAFRVWLRPISGVNEEVATVSLLSRAEEIEQGQPEYLAELERWVRTDPAAVDGVPVAAVPGEDPATRPSNWLVRDFVVGSRPAAGPGAAGGHGRRAGGLPAHPGAGLAGDAGAAALPPRARRAPAGAAAAGPPGRRRAPSTNRRPVAEVLAFAG